MLARKYGYGSFATLGAVAALFLVVAVREAAASQATAPPSLRFAYRDVGCGFPAYRGPDGSCQPLMGDDRNCQPGFHAVSASIGNGYRCVPDGD